MTRKLVKFNLLYLLLTLALWGCPKRSTQGLKAYQLASDDAYVGGSLIDLYANRVVNQRDFSYALAFSPSGHWLAYTHLVSADFQLSLVATETGLEQWSVSLNSSEFDVEAVVFVDEDHIAVAARRSPVSSHPSVRLYSRIDGHLLAAAQDDDLAGLVQVERSPDHKILASVSAHLGAVILRDSKNMAWLGEFPAHRGSARAIVFINDREFFSGGDDGRLLRWKLEPYLQRQAGEIQLSRVLVGAQKQLAIPVELPNSGPLLAAVNTGFKRSVIGRDLAKRLQLPDPKKTIPLQSQAGEIEAQIRPADLLLRDLVVPDVDFAVCDTCLPLGCDLILGDDLQDRISLSPGREQGLFKLQVHARTAQAASSQRQHIPEPRGQHEQMPRVTTVQPGQVMPVKSLPKPRQYYRAKLLSSVQLSGSINDLRISRDRTKLVVALSEKPAERSLQLYEQEKAGHYPAPKSSNAAVLFDVATGRELKRFIGPRGYVVSADISPDGQTVATGSWDNHVLFFAVDTGAQIFDQPMAWLVRRLRFAPDGRSLGVAAWTPVASFGGNSKPALVIFDLVYADPKISKQ